MPQVLESAREAQAIFDPHTLDLLEFDKVRELLASYAACSLGKDLARQLEPLGDADKIRTELALVSEMADALGQGLVPPFAGLHDVRLIVRRAAIGSQMSIEELLQTADTLGCTGNMYRYRMRLTERHGRLIELLRPSKTWDMWRKQSPGASTVADTSSTWPAGSWPRYARN